MVAWLMVAYSALAYLFFFATFAYAVAFAGGFAVARQVDIGPASAPGAAIAIDLALLAVFAVQHSVMARPAFKRWWTRIVPEPIERSTYVVAASAALALLLWQWRPIARPVIWDVQAPLAQAAIWAVFGLGWGMLLAASFLIDHFALFGLRQPFAFATGRPLGEPEFAAPGLYRVVRHPIYLGFLMSFWAAPHMSAGHLLFALATTGYIFVGIFFEERDLVAQLGERYRVYRTQVAMILPFPRSRKALDAASRSR